MLTKRIIPCLDVKNGRTVKGINFKNLRDAGDPVALAKSYAAQGADELVFLDITATIDCRKTMYNWVNQVAQALDIPFTVGGGITSVKDVEALLKLGADKIAINSAAVRNPQLINDISNAFGSQCVVVAVDAKKINDDWFVYLNGGRLQTNRRLFDWVKEAAQRGAGEILFTSMNHDGTKKGFALKALNHINKLINIPIIASGGAGTMAHFAEVFKNGQTDAALAASVFHFGEIGIPELKNYLKKQNISIRL